MSQTPELMRQQNRAIILATIQEQGPISRVDLADLLGLNPATITRITRHLIEEGLVKEEGEGTTKGAGRKPVLLSFNHSARLVIGIYADNRQATGVIADLASHIHTRRTMLLSAKLTASLLLPLIDELLDEYPDYRQRLAAICIGVSLPDTDTLQQKLQIPVITSDVVSLAAVAEAEVGGLQTFLMLYLGDKSQSCIYFNGISRTGQPGLDCDGKPLAEKLCNAGLINTFMSLRENGIPTTLGNPVKARLIFEAARRDDPAAKQAVEKIADDLAFSIGWMCNALTLTHVVIAGSWLWAADLLLPMLTERLNPLPVLSAAKLGDEAPLMGAVRAAIKIAEPTF